MQAVVCLHAPCSVRLSVCTHRAVCDNAPYSVLMLCCRAHGSLRMGDAVPPPEMQGGNPGWFNNPVTSLEKLAVQLATSDVPALEKLTCRVRHVLSCTAEWCC